MTSHASVARLLEFRVVQHRQAVAQLQLMISDFERTAETLDHEIRIEEDRANKHDPSHFTYPTYAKAAIERRDNLRRSSNELKFKLDAANRALSQAIEKLEVAQVLKVSDRIEELEDSLVLA